MHTCADCGSHNVVTTSKPKNRGKFRLYTNDGWGWSKTYFGKIAEAYDEIRRQRSTGGVSYALCAHTPDEPGDMPPGAAVVYYFDRQHYVAIYEANKLAAAEAAETAEAAAEAAA